MKFFLAMGFVSRFCAQTSPQGSGSFANGEVLLRKIRGQNHCKKITRCFPLCPLTAIKIEHKDLERTKNGLNIQTEIAVAEHGTRSQIIRSPTNFFSWEFEGASQKDSAAVNKNADSFFILLF